MQTQQKKFLTRAESANYLTNERGAPTAKTTLQKYATTGGGPKYQVFGNRALYQVADLDEWVAGKLSAPRHSTTAGEVK
ncbi:MAG: hypothetical protein PHV02_07730 [Rhodocyclaceae bacterium]|nr:hypothetical protein [Rhodocyclaceae bacterium]